jgi:hypothetical protein
VRTDGSRAEFPHEVVPIRTGNLHEDQKAWRRVTSAVKPAER